MIRVLLVDDHTLVRSAVAAVLNAAEGIEVVGECTDGAQVTSVARTVQPDVVLMDVRMPITSGIDATRYLLAELPDVRVVMLTASGTMRNMEAAAESGAVGFLIKGRSPHQLVDAVRAVAAGGTAWPCDMPTATLIESH
jgi:DNA-binding NarL/FixJ family response regulator